MATDNFIPLTKTNIKQLTIYSIGKHEQAQAKNIAKHFDLSHTNICNLNDKKNAFPLWFLTLNNNELQLHYRDNNCKPLLIDFNNKKNTYRRHKANPKTEPLAKAIAFSYKNPPQILDLTAGLGQDALVLASLGCTVTMIERDNVVAALLDNAMQRFSQQAKNNTQNKPQDLACSQRMHLYHNESLKIIKNPQSTYGTNINNTNETITKLEDKITKNEFDVIYLDPMFPEQSYKKSLVKKNIRMLRAIIRSDTSSAPEELLNYSLKTNVKRVVVKRPADALPLGGITPHHSNIGRSNRFDIYINK